MIYYNGIMRSERFAEPPSPEQIPTDPYELLGVDRAASDEEINRAFKKLAPKYHPDTNPGDAAAEEHFKAISNARDLLVNPQKNQSSVPPRRPAPPTSPFDGFFRQEQARQENEKRERAKREAENEKQRQEREVEYERERVEARQRQERETARWEAERKERLERERQQQEELERRQQEEAQLKEVGRLTHELEMLQDRYVGEVHVQEDLNHKYPQIFKLAFGDEPTRYNFGEIKKDSERKIDETLSRLAVASQSSIEEVKEKFDTTLREKMKQREIQALNYWRGFVEKNIRYAEGEIETLEQDLGKFKYKNIRSGKAAGRSMMQEFLRSKGFWPGLEKIQKQIQAKQAEITKLQDGIKEIETTISAL